ncbi:XRE family transcriptional regulator [Novosphingobium album (ex Liu et al. 2023)]|uniref:XRE family transcriptional regulator n=1 Tax=Novosphingobium album (ex Liu et al. 2023) TaxID=3031130 RepID=A0ABT5WY22_9SPHN|nr:XRE family transcriptional regulator [Novosphingobium album (ex Liu et al. 2023)]MDE8654797.1 XRE family transcriptional regulator [Novosphingobium album (ex Liu et al. 2023)]
MPRTLPMSPGTYLRLRREAADLPLPVLAAQVAGAPDRLRPVTAGDRLELQRRIEAAERDEAPLTMPQAALLRRAFPFELGVYELLLLRHQAGPGNCLPEPQLCRFCGCSWHDCCATTSGRPCAWVEGDPTLCTACARRAEAQARQTEREPA